jgi:hypothetical protein
MDKCGGLLEIDGSEAYISEGACHFHHVIHTILIIITSSGPFTLILMEIRRDISCENESLHKWFLNESALCPILIVGELEAEAKKG